MTKVVSSFRIRPPRRFSPTQRLQQDGSNARSVRQGFSPAALLARNQQASASVARMNKSPGRHSPRRRRTISHDTPVLAGLLQINAGRLSNWAASSRGKDSHKRSSRTTKRQLSPTAVACHHRRRESSATVPIVSPNMVAKAPALAFASPCQGMRSQGTPVCHSSCAGISQFCRESSVRPQRSGGSATNASVKILAQSLAKADSLAPSAMAMLAGLERDGPAGPGKAVRNASSYSSRRLPALGSQNLLGGPGTAFTLPSAQVRSCARSDIQELDQGHHVGVEHVPS